MGKIPRFKSDKEAAEYWDRESVVDHLDELEPVEVQVAEPLSHVLSVRLSGEDMRKLDDLAGAQGVGLSALIRMMIRQAPQDTTSPIYPMYGASAEVQREVVKALRRLADSLEKELQERRVAESH